ncbi:MULTISPECIES: hypothetical protein [unclassified Streptomyces]|uniref:hypothetical protein n=1 Tax=unclassified Streptomyces TaxID=2593676 RepID=UPI001F3E6837|nr:hypothetical protein [Streptomyces sp. NBRC 110465]
MKWQVVALSGQMVHLVGPDDGGETVLAGYLFADPGFAVVGADVPQAAPQWGLFETAPAAAREKALAWQRHVREVECGLPCGPGSERTVREQYDPAGHTLAQQEQAKAEELTALGSASHRSHARRCSTCGSPTANEAPPLAPCSRRPPNHTQPGRTH